MQPAATLTLQAAEDAQKTEAAAPSKAAEKRARRKAARAAAAAAARLPSAPGPPEHAQDNGTGAAAPSAVEDTAARLQGISLADVTAVQADGTPSSTAGTHRDSKAAAAEITQRKRLFNQPAPGQPPPQQQPSWMLCPITKVCSANC